MDHADYPHTAGTLYDCGMCESKCYCDNLDGIECVHCADKKLKESAYGIRSIHDTRRYQSQLSESTERQAAGVDGPRQPICDCCAVEPFEGRGPFEPPF